MEKIFHKEVFSWGGMNLEDINDERSHYILALRAADEGNFLPLLSFAQTGE